MTKAILAAIFMTIYIMPDTMVTFVDEWDRSLVKVSYLFKFIGLLGLIIVVGW